MLIPQKCPLSGPRPESAKPPPREQAAGGHDSAGWKVDGPEYTIGPRHFTGGGANENAAESVFQLDTKKTLCKDTQGFARRRAATRYLPGMKGFLQVPAELAHPCEPFR
jgi:hypothetical protein